MRATHDDALLAACAAGDGDAWRELVERYGRLVYSIPRRYRLDDADCDDVHQAAFTALVTAVGAGRTIESIGPWLATVAHRESWRIGRSRGRAIALADFASVADPDPVVVREIEEEQAVREGLDALGSPCKDLLTALFSAGAEPHYSTLSTQLDMPVGSIGPTRARCLAKLERILRDRGITAAASGTHGR